MATAASTAILPALDASPTGLLGWLKSCTSSPSILLLDGGVSTYLEHVLLQRKQVFQYRELWSSSLLLSDEGANDIAHCHDVFREAGADILSSVTYQCHYGVHSSSAIKTNHDETTTSTDDTKNNCVVDHDTMTRMIRRGIRLAKDHTKLYVAASLGCYGAALADGSEYRGDYHSVPHNIIRDFHKLKLETAVMEQPDAVAFETVPNGKEVIVVAKLLRDLHLSGIATWISLACRNECELNDGTQIKNVLDELTKVDPDGTIVHAIGFNCCDGYYVPGLLRILVQHMATCGPRRGIVVYPNSGEEWDASTSTWKHGTGCIEPSDFAMEMRKSIKVVESTWKDTCASNDPTPKLIIGGCCRTSPATIVALRALVDEQEMA